MLWTFASTSYSQLLVEKVGVRPSLLTLFFSTICRVVPCVQVISYRNGWRLLAQLKLFPLCVCSNFGLASASLRSCFQFARNADSFCVSRGTVMQPVFSD
jgi:hypothetical protein